MLRRSVTAELVVLSAVVAAVALLTNLPPGNVPSAVSAAATAPAGGAATVALRNGGRSASGRGRRAQRVPAVAAGRTAGPACACSRRTARPQPTVPLRPVPRTWLAWPRGCRPAA